MQIPYNLFKRLRRLVILEAFLRVYVGIDPTTQKHRGSILGSPSKCSKLGVKSPPLATPPLGTQGDGGAGGRGTLD